MPGGQLPLRIFEPRYVSMITTALKGDSEFGICLIDSGSEVGSVATPYPFGTLVKIVDWDREDSGLLVIVVQGMQRFRIVSSAAAADMLLVGEVELLPMEKKIPVPVKYQGLSDLLKRAVDQLRPFLDHTDTDFSDASWLSCRLVELLPMSESARHELVAMEDPIERLAILHDYVEQKSFPE